MPFWVSGSAYATSASTLLVVSSSNAMKRLTYILPILVVGLFIGFGRAEAATTYLYYDANWSGATLDHPTSDIATNGDVYIGHFSNIGHVDWIEATSTPYEKIHATTVPGTYHAPGYDGIGNTNVNTQMAGQPPGNYVYAFGGGDSTGTGAYCFFTWNGTVGDYTQCSNAPVPGGDNPELTGVIRYVSPALYATTTSPFDLTFDGVVNANASTTDGFKVTFVSDSGCTRTYYGLLPSYTVGTPFRYSTTTSALDGFCSGALRMTVEFGGGVHDAINYGSQFYGSGYALGEEFSFNTATYQSALNFTTTPPPFGGYASTSCAFNMNPFAASTFNLDQCAGYLFVPQANGFAAYTTFKDSLNTKFPFSYFASAIQTWNGLQAGNLNQSPTYQFNLHDLNIGGSENFLPNTTVFSASTTKQWFPSGSFDLLKGLASAAIWLTFLLYVFFHTRDLMKAT